MRSLSPKRIVRSSMIATVLVSAICTSASAISSTFATDLDGWFESGSGGAATFEWVSAGGNPGGYARVSATATSVLNAPSKFLGDLRAFDGGTLSFDQNLIVPPAVDGFGYGFVTLVSSDRSRYAELDLIPATPPPGWNSWSAPFTASAWGLAQSEWEQLLADIGYIQVVIEAGTSGSSDVSGFDNFSIIPEPSTALLLLAGLCGLCARKTKRV